MEDLAPSGSGASYLRWRLRQGAWKNSSRSASAIVVTALAGQHDFLPDRCRVHIAQRQNNTRRQLVVVFYRITLLINISGLDQAGSCNYAYRFLCTVRASLDRHRLNYSGENFANCNRRRAFHEIRENDQAHFCERNGVGDRTYFSASPSSKSDDYQNSYGVAAVQNDPAVRVISECGTDNEGQH
jgi:hypothetical protein